MVTNNTLAHTEDSVLLIIDIQERLSNAMPVGVKERVIEQVAVLLTAADRLSVPVILTEQYPKGLGHTESALLEKLPDGSPVIEKTHFSSLQVEEVESALTASGKKQVILAGMETHICILQTALDLLNKGYEVFVVEDAVSSRAKGNQFNALQRLRFAGAVITNVESLMFEWLRDAKHPHFKELSKLIV